MIGQHIPFSKVLNGRVNGAAITEAEYDKWDYRLMAEYTNDQGRPVQIFAVTYAGIQRASEDRRNRIVAARTRRESDDEWSNHIARMVEP